MSGPYSGDCLIVQFILILELFLLRRLILEMTDLSLHRPSLWRSSVSESDTKPRIYLNRFIPRGQTESQPNVSTDLRNDFSELQEKGYSSIFLQGTSPIQPTSESPRCYIHEERVTNQGWL